VYTLVRARAHPSLRGFVDSYDGYVERSPGPVGRLEVPHRGIVLWISFEEPMRVEAGTFTSFVAGLHDHAVWTEHDGRQGGVQVGLSPQAAFALTGQPTRHLTNAVLPIEDVFGPATRELVERLAEAVSWRERFELLDAVFAARLAVGPAPCPTVGWLWDRLVETGGRVSVEALAREVGWSRRRLAARFAEEVGLAPKLAARVLRFEHATTLLRCPQSPPLAAVASLCGYYDQAHMNRDFTEFAGMTPGAFFQDARG
jgi:AraC-like DNA-binding protein